MHACRTPASVPALTTVDRAPFPENARRDVPGPARPAGGRHAGAAQGRRALPRGGQRGAVHAGQRPGQGVGDAGGGGRRDRGGHEPVHAQAAEEPAHYQLDGDVAARGARPAVAPLSILCYMRTRATCGSVGWGRGTEPSPHLSGSLHARGSEAMTLPAAVFLVVAFGTRPRTRTARPGLAGAWT